jgi:hypothetical protein
MEANVSKRPPGEEEATTVVEHLIGDNANVVRWLEQIGLISVDDKGRWCLSPCATAALARRQQQGADPASGNSRLN